jgi:hypothetical protein
MIQLKMSSHLSLVECRSDLLDLTVVDDFQKWSEC